MLKAVNTIAKFFLIFLISLIAEFNTQFAQESSKLFIQVQENEMKDNHKVKEILSKIKQKNDILEYYLVSLKDSNAIPDMKNLEFNIGKYTIGMKVKRIQKSSEKKYLLSAENNEFGYALISSGENGLMGFIQSKSEGYRLEHISDGIYLITKLDMKIRANREKDFVDYIEDHPIRMPLPKVNSTETSETINLIIAYTGAAKNDCGGNIREYARYAVDCVNYTYANSGVNIYINLVYLYQTALTETANMVSDLISFQNDAQINTLRYQYYANVCALMVANTENNGVGFFQGIVDSRPFLVVNYDAASSQWALAHEIGHLIGVRHQIGDDPRNEPKPHGHGHYLNGPSSNSGWRTVMAVQGGGSISDIRIPYYSSPNINYGGDFLSNDGYRTDNVRALTELINSIYKQGLDFQEPSRNTYTFNLMQNFPNPFNPTTSIIYSLKYRQNVVLKVYNILGAEVATLVNEIKEPGQYTVQFNASNLPSGTYVYSIQAGDFSSRRKLSLVK